MLSLTWVEAFIFVHLLSNEIASYTVYSGYNDSGYNDFPDIRHALVGPGRFPISAMHFTPDIIVVLPVKPW